MALVHPVKHRAAAPLKSALLILPASFLFALLLGIDKEGWWQLPLFLGAGLAAFLVWRSIAWPDNLSRFTTFGGVLLLALVLNRFIYGADFLLHGSRFHEWPFPANFPEWAHLKAEIMTLVGSFVVVGVWLAGGGPRYSPAILLKESRSQAKSIFLVTYVVSLFGIGLQKWSPDLVGSLGQLVPTLLALGSAAALLIPHLVFRRSLSRILVALVLSAPFLDAALNTGMKEAVFLAALPAAATIWIALPSVIVRATMVSVGILLIGLLTSYNSHFRKEVWRTNPYASRVEVMESYADTVSTIGLPTIIGDGLAKFIKRANTSAYRGWAPSWADEYRSEPALVFEPLVYVFIPRAIAPGKPLIDQGDDFTRLLYGERFADLTGTSTAAGFFPALYLGAGWPAVLIGAILAGLLVVSLARLAFQLGGPVLGGLFAISLIPFGLRLDESWVVAAFSRPVISFAYTLFVFLIVRAVARVFQIRKQTDGVKPVVNSGGSTQ